VRNQEGRFLLQTIGIVGTERGNGVTHLAIMLGNYITAKLHKNTAILEMNPTNAFAELKESYGNQTNKNQELDYFEISKVTYYCNVRKAMFGRIFSKDYDYIIMDMGTDRHLEEFMKCNVRIVIGSLNPWKNKKFICCIENDIAQGYLGKIKYVVPFSSYEEIRQIKNAYKSSIHITPFEPDPFLIHGCNLEFLNQLLNQ
jgi:hypothetical protein